MKSHTPSFSIEYELDLTKPQAAFLERRRKTAISIYNSCLGEALHRLHKLQHDCEYQRLRTEYLSARKAGFSVRKISDGLHARCVYFGFTEYDMHEYVVSDKRHYGTIGIDECQKLASRAFAAVSKILYGKAKSVRFVSRDEDFSMEGKSLKSTLKFDPSSKQMSFGRNHVFRTKPVRNQKTAVYTSEALQNRLKYCRLVSRTIRGKRRWFVQPVLEGIPPKKHTYGPYIPVGIDEGVSTAAVSCGNHVILKELAPDISIDAKRLRRLQRAADRSRRSMNPDNYNPDRTVIRGRHTWIRSKLYIRIRNSIREMNRRIAAKRKQSHERLANEIIALGTDIRVETMQMQALSRRSRHSSQNSHGKLRSRKRYGKTIASRAPAMLISIIDRKLHYIGTEVHKLDTWNLKASQYNHVTDSYTKKQLSDRICVIGNETVQRDMYSAFLIEHTDPDGYTINRNQCISDFRTFAAACQSEISSIRQNGSHHLQWYVTV